MAKQLGCYLGLWGILLVGWGCHAPEPATDVDTPLFEEVTSEAGLADFRHQTGAFGKKWMPESLGGGGGFVDIDGDGWSDIVLVTGAHWPGHGPALPALTVYRNRGDGTFENWTEKTGLDRYTAYGMGLAAADYDNDGDMDLFLTALGPNLLFRNEGGRFIEVSREADYPAMRNGALQRFFWTPIEMDGWISSTETMWTGPQRPICFAQLMGYIKIIARHVSTQGCRDAFSATTATAPSLSKPTKPALLPCLAKHLALPSWT